MWVQHFELQGFCWELEIGLKYQLEENRLGIWFCWVFLKDWSFSNCSSLGMEWGHLHVVAFRQLVISEVLLQQFSHTQLILRANETKCCVPSLLLAHSGQEPRIPAGVCYHSDQPPHLQRMWEEATRPSPAALHTESAGTLLSAFKVTCN